MQYKVDNMEEIRILKNNANNIIKKEYFLNDERHRLNKPAIIVYEGDKCLKSISFYEYGLKKKNDFYPCDIEYNESKIEILIYNFENDVFYPNYIEFFKNGKIRYFKFNNQKKENIFREVLEKLNYNINQHVENNTINVKNTEVEDYLKIQYDIEFHTPFKLN